MAAQAEQIRRVEARVTEFAATHGLERITMAVTGASAIATGSVACAGLLPLPYAAVAIAALFAMRTAVG